MTVEWNTVEARYPAVSRLDPYVEWSLGPGRPHYFLPGRQAYWVPILLRLEGIKPRDFADGTDFIGSTFVADWRKSLRIAQPYLKREEANGYVSALASEKFFEAMQANPKVRELARRVALGLPLTQDSLPLYDDPPWFDSRPPHNTPPAAKSVVIGVIDDGIAFAHERFRTDAGTRIEYWWLQDGHYIGPTSSVSTGCELTKGEIDNRLNGCTSGGVLDEELFYASVGLIDFGQDRHKTAAWRAAHGTHVMDVACGFDAVPPRYDRPIVAVQLPVGVTADTSGGNLFPYVAVAMDYIVDRANALAGDGPPLPLVINLSYGLIAGPHDGTSDLERHIDELVARRPNTSVVLPAGNNFLSRCHAQVSFPALDRVEELHWRVIPDDQTPSYLEIWLPRRELLDGEQIKLQVVPPSGYNPSPWIDEDPSVVHEWGTAPNVHAQVVYRPPMPPAMRGSFLISLKPTISLDSTQPIAPAGAWRVRMRNMSLGPLELVHAWIQRDDSLHGHPLRGRQSYFDDARYKCVDDAGRLIESDDPASPVKREGTINAIATGAKSIVMGGFLRKQRLAARYSSSGQKPGLSPPLIRGPDAMAASEDSRDAHHGVLAAGTRSGSVVAMGGTSVAAPAIARWIADELAAGNSGDRPAVQNRAVADDIYLSPPPQPSPECGGAGRTRLRPIVPLNRLDE